MTDGTDELVLVRASIHLPGLTPGDEVWVDPNDPYIAERMEVGYLQRIPSQEAEGDDGTTEEPVGEAADGTAEPPAESPVASDG